MGKPSLYIEKMHTTFFIKNNRQESVKIIHHKIQSNHSALRNPPIGEVSYQGLYPKKQK
jgi:hypothetical protein